MADNIYDQFDDAAPEALPAPSLSERFWLNFDYGQRFNTIAGAVSGTMRADTLAERLDFEGRYVRTPGWQTAAEGAAALAGQIAGTAASPENFVPIGLGEKIVVGSKMAVTGLWARVFAGAVDGAAANAVADLAIQGVEMANEARGAFDAERYAAGILLGAGIGGAVGGVGHLADRRAANPFDALDEAAPDTAPAAAAPEAPAPDRAAAIVPPDAPTVPVETPEAAPPRAALSEPAAAPPAEPPTLGEALSAKAATARGVARQERVVADALAPLPNDRPRRPPSLIEFIADAGGIKDYKGELAAYDLDKIFIPGRGRVVRSNGRSLDMMREAAAEAGYFDQLYGTPDEAVAKSTVSDLLDLIGEDASTRSIYASGDRPELNQWQAVQDAKTARQEIRTLVGRAAADLETLVSDDTAIRMVAAMREHKLDAADALERVAMEDYYSGEINIKVERADGTDYDVPWPDLPGRDAQRAAVQGRGEAGPSRQEARSDAPVSPVRGSGDPQADYASERTAAGQQSLISGVRPVTAREKIDVLAARPLRGGSQAPGGLFDETVTRQTDIADFLDMAAPAAIDGQRGRALAGVAAKAADGIARVRDTAEALAKALDVAATRQGRMSGKAGGKLGQYGTKSGVVRVRSLDDFDTLTHEFGHAFEGRSAAARAFIKANAADLKALDYDPAKGRPQEGFAEFVRLWVTNRAHAETRHPRLADGFHAMLAAEPEAAAAFDAAAQAWTAYLEAPSSMAVASTIVSAKRPGWLARTAKAVADNGVTGTIADALQRLYTFALDDLGPLDRAVTHLKAVHYANTGRTLDLDVAADPYKLARMSRGAWSAGHMDIMYGVAPYRQLHPASPSLRDAIIEATGKPNALARWDEAKVRDFGAYLWSRRALGEWARFEAGDIPNPPDKLTKGDHAVNVADMEAANPQFVAAAAKVHGFARALWKKKFDAGLIDEATYRDGLAIADYVPGLRDFSRETDTGGAGGKRAKGGFVRRFKGSKRDVINPVESLAGDAYETAMAIARNDVAKTLARLALEAGPGGGAIAEIVPAKAMTATMIDPLEAVERAAQNAGLAKPDIVTLRDAVEGAIGEEKAAIFRPATINEKGEPIVFYRDGGALKALRLADGRFGKDLYRAMTAMAPVERNFFIEMLAIPARAVRFGATTALEFIGANFVRDQAMASIYYGRPFRRVARTLQGLGDDLLGREAAIAYNRVGGLSGGQETASMGAAHARRDISALKRKGWPAQRLTSWRGFFTLAETSETATRIGLFRTFREEASARGLDDFEAAMEAAWRARDYIDFDRHGAVTAAINRIVPFFNVSLQGIDKSARTMIAPLARRYLSGRPLDPSEARAAAEAVKAWARLAAVTVAGMSLHALMKRHPDYDEISAQTRATHWMVRAGERWLAIPKPFEMAVFLNLGEAAFDAMAAKDPTAWARWRDSVMTATAPPSAIEGNPSLRNWFEVKTNTDLRTGAPIVPEHLAGLEPFLQHTARTSRLARAFGTWFNVSPAVAEHVFVSHTASWGRTLLSLYDLAQPDAPGFAWDDAPIARRFIKDAAKGATSTTQFWGMVGEREGALTGKARTYQALGATEREDYYARQDEQTRAFIAADAMNAKTKRLHPLINARNAVQAIGTLRREIASNAVRQADGTILAVDAAARTAADDILSSLAMAVSRNALATIGEPGWANRPPMDEDGFYRELEAAAPALFDILGGLYSEKKVWRSDAVAAAWPEFRARLLADGGLAEAADLRAVVEAEGRPVDGIRRPAKPKAKPGG